MVIFIQDTTSKLTPLLDSICVIYCSALETMLLALLHNFQRATWPLRVEHIKLCRREGLHHCSYLCDLSLLRIEKVNNSLQIILHNHKLQHQGRRISNKD